LIAWKIEAPAHRPGLPGKEILFLLCPFLPAGRQGPCPEGRACRALAGQDRSTGKSGCRRIL